MVVVVALVGVQPGGSASAWSAAGPDGRYAADEGFEGLAVVQVRARDVFQWGWFKDLFGLQATGPIMSLMPILLVGIVFGLAMDYQVFLVTRIREAYVHGAEPRAAITEGFRHSGKVVIAAALIMTGVFGGFVGGDDAMIKSLGFGLAVAVIFDAFVVRMTIVPAVLALLGQRAWSLPGWLDRRLPHVDIEGEKLGSAVPAPHEPAPRDADFTPTR